MRLLCRHACRLEITIIKSLSTCMLATAAECAEGVMPNGMKEQKGRQYPRNFKDGLQEVDGIVGSAPASGMPPNGCINASAPSVDDLVRHAWGWGLRAQLLTMDCCANEVTPALNFCMNRIKCLPTSHVAFTFGN